jgi:crotonobetainyl-CoA:carnitine CoA-transferase CaiB-like acyl-CoA transferase
MSIFANIKILDLTRVLSGPLATRHFAQQGAEVIKIESISGDDTRNFPPLVGSWSGYFEMLNYNKKSVVIDLKSVRGLNYFYKLCKTADVIVENYSSEVKGRLKIDFQTLAILNPQLIYASLSGVSAACSRKYYDIVAQGETGLISLNNNHVNRTAIIDSFAGMKLAFAISSALYSREKTKLGLQLYVSMKGCSFDLLEQNLLQTSFTKVNPDTTSDTSICPFGVFATKDRHITLGIGNQSLWHSFVLLMTRLNCPFGFEKYTSNQMRLDDRDLINQNIQAEFAKHPSKKLIKLLHDNNIPASPVNTMLDVLADTTNFEHNLLQKIIVPGVGHVVIPTGGVYFSNHPNTKYKLAPKLNQDG